ncbi:hypothetical protein DFH06DRAFT_1203206 [Mycena polygramma]|nr:hypothetical protein DFH06DRAFT_1203206 [Mycena polygramma]
MFSRSLLRPVQAHSLAIRHHLAPASRSASTSHTADSYTKEVDSSPAADPTIHRVDPSSENVQKPHEAPSGPWSATGVEAGVTNAQGAKHESAGPHPGVGDRYGGKTSYEQEKGGNPQESTRSTEKQGPQGSESGGRKPEGR